MLHLITWSAFLKTIIILTFIYYGIILSLYYRKEIGGFLHKRDTEI